METFLASKTDAPVKPSSCFPAAVVDGSGSVSLIFCSGSSMESLARVAGESSGDDAGDKQQDKRDGDECQCGAPGPVLSAYVGRQRVGEDLRGQGRGRAAEQVGIGGLDQADGEKQRRRLARGP